MTFAYHLPDNYTREKFARKELDYGSGRYEFAAELWGRPANVSATLDAQNEVLRQLARESDNTLFVDMQARLPKSGRVFSDVCHLTPEGCQQIVELMLPALEDWVRTMDASHAAAVAVP